MNRVLKALLLCVAGGQLVACSPTYNWRTVSLKQLSMNLPCKPDRAERPVQLAGQTMVMSMAGCETGGAIFAVSHVQVNAVTQTRKVLEAWQIESLANLRAQVSAATPISQLPSPPGNGLVPELNMTVRGQSPAGEPLQANLRWFVRGAEVYHVAVYAATIEPAVLEALTAELQWK
ncbi:hypothetical protein [Rhodoferax aquaticus]|uniref:Uncharacterized protein n=1 Tax=Rhodoferax aquaticus TaxID=2527691 RepID=A0A515EUQ7_9BURK|nr:hypothetical protein [Rhodoferax aquaticus]QDL56339.1 hypothetical protein EXZ61_20475 [Rhodoferax aquaticus]